MIPTALSDWPADTATPLLHLSVGELLGQHAIDRPTRPALIWTHDDGLAGFSYAELLDVAETGARLLLADAAPGDPMAIWAPNSHDWVVAEYAAALAGRPVVPLNPAFTDDEALDILGGSGAVTLLTVDDSAGRRLYDRATALQERLVSLRDVRLLGGWHAAGHVSSARLPEVDPYSTLLVQYTSGTTGRPKGAVLSHSAALNAARLSALALRAGDDDVWCTPLPLHHVGASVCGVLAVLGVGGAWVVLPRFEPALLLRTLSTARVTHTGGVPTMWIDAMAHPDFHGTDLSALRTLMVGGSAVAPALIRRIEADLGVRVCNGYGQSEAPNLSQTDLDDPDVDKAETIGRLLPHHGGRVVGSGSLDPLPLGQVGELVIQSPLVMSGYLNQPVATSEVLRDGWLRTGDLVSMDGRGVLRFHGRSREVVIRGGENIYPREVEDAIRPLRGVADVAVVGAADDRWGERVVAFVRRDKAAQLDIDTLTVDARERLAPFKVPAEWYVVDELPLTATGKVAKFRLTEWLALPEHERSSRPC